MNKIGSLQINGFRALTELQLDDIRPITLLVGRNNTGKTTVLEALRMLLAADVRTQLYDLLVDRDEYRLHARGRDAESRGPDAGPPMSYEALFSGRPPVELGGGFWIRSPHYRLAVQLTWLLRRTASEDASIRYAQIEGQSDNPDAVPGFAIETESAHSLVPIDRLGYGYRRRVVFPDTRKDLFDTPVVYLPSRGMSAAEIGEIWDSIALTDEEEQVVLALHIIAPKLEKLVMVQSPRSRSERMLMAKLKNFANPVPFKSLGEGSTHLLSIALAIIKARNGFVLIDEVENGIHYSVQDRLWRLIAEQSHNFNVQVFATTHSWDCVRALHHAGQFDTGTISLFRLEEVDNRINAVRFSGEELAIADDAKIEIR